MSDERECAFVVEYLEVDKRRVEDPVAVRTSRTVRGFKMPVRRALLCGDAVSSEGGGVSDGSRARACTRSCWPSPVVG
jgi:hypothetical protein